MSTWQSTKPPHTHAASGICWCGYVFNNARKKFAQREDTTGLYNRKGK